MSLSENERNIGGKILYSDKLNCFRLRHKDTKNK